MRYSADHRRLVQILVVALTIAFVGAASWALPTTALAAFWVRMSLNPSTPIAGQPVHVSVLTFALANNGCWNDPTASPIPVATWYGNGSTPQAADLRIAARGPDSSEMQTVLTQRKSDGSYWDGDLTFPTAGTWKVLVLAFGAQLDWSQADTLANRCGGLFRTVNVLEAGHVAPYPVNRPPPNPLSSVAAVIALLVIATIVLLGVRRILLSRRGRRPDNHF